MNGKSTGNWDADSGLRTELANRTASQTEKLGADGMTYPIGFIVVTTNPANGHAVGGMLVTDNSGVPLEFMITSAVRPTRTQRILYGARLGTYVAVELCAKELVRNIKTKPRVVFVRDPEMLAVTNHTSIPVLMLLKTEALGSEPPLPTVKAPEGKQDYEDCLDLTSLHGDMLEVFDRIEKCRAILAESEDSYRLFDGEPGSRNQATDQRRGMTP